MNVAKGWFKIYCSTFTTVGKSSFPKGLSSFVWSSLLQTAPYLRIVFAWLGFLYTLTLHRWAQAHQDLSHVLHSITSALNPSILHSCWHGPSPHPPSSNQLLPHHLLSMLVLGIWILVRDKVASNFPSNISSSINAILWTTYV